MIFFFTFPAIFLLFPTFCYFYLLMYFGPRAGNPARGPVRAAKMGCGPAGRGLRARPVTTSIVRKAESFKAECSHSSGD